MKFIALITFIFLLSPGVRARDDDGCSKFLNLATEYLVTEGNREDGVVAKIQATAKPTFKRSAPQIEHHSPLDIQYQISNQGDEVFVVRTFALNTPQHQLERDRKLWYKIRYKTVGDQVMAEMFILENQNETRMGAYTFPIHWIEHQERSKQEVFKISGRPVLFEFDETGYSSPDFPDGFTTQLRFDLYQIIVEALLKARKKAG